MIETERDNKFKDIVIEAESIAESSERRRAFGKSFAKLIAHSLANNFDSRKFAQDLIEVGGVSSPTIGRQIGRIIAAKSDFNHYLNPLLVSMEIKRKEVF